MSSDGGAETAVGHVNVFTAKEISGVSTPTQAINSMTAQHGFEAAVGGVPPIFNGQEFNPTLGHVESAAHNLFPAAFVALTTVALFNLGRHWLERRRARRQ